MDAHRRQGDEHREEAHGVGGEAEAGSEGGDDHAADRGPDDPRRVEERGVERDRIRELGRPDHLVRERLPRGCVEHQHHASQHGEHVHLPWLDVAEQRQQRQERRRDHRGRLRRHHEPARVEPVGEDAGKEAEHAERQELAEDEDADRDRRSGQLEHEPRHRDVLHPRSRDRDRLADEEQPVVAMPEAGERAPVQAQERRGHGRASMSVAQRLDRVVDRPPARRRRASAAGRRATRCASSARA